MSSQVDISWNTWIEQGARDEWLPCCGPGVPRPCAPARMFGCTRRSKTLGSMLQQANYFTGFVGKWHLSPPPGELGRGASTGLGGEGLRMRGIEAEGLEGGRGGERGRGAKAASHATLPGFHTPSNFGRLNNFVGAS